MIVTALLGTTMVLGQFSTALATQLPDPASSLFLQTSGPNAGISIGDFHTSPAGGNTDHLFIVRVPSNWPSGVPVTVSLFDPELAGPNPVSPTAADEVRGAADSATFRLDSPFGAVLATQTYTTALTNGLWVDLATFDPGTTGTGTYELHVSVSDDDDNSWRIDASHDPDCAVGGPGSCGALNVQDGDESDTAPSGSGALGVGVVRTSYQHAGSGTVCQDHIFYVNNATPRPLRAHNFDMDGNGSVTYTDPTGIMMIGSVSGNGAWNGSSGVTRVGDVLPDINGWWTAELCISSTNQYVFEAPSAGPSFPVPQPEPRLTIVKDDGTTDTEIGEELTYDLTVTNVSDTDPMPGDAHDVVVTDTLPAGVSYVGCAAPAFVDCAHVGGVVTATHQSTLDPGESFTIEVIVSVGPTVATPLTNVASVTYDDRLGNELATVEAEDSDDVAFMPVLRIQVSGPTRLLRGDSALLTYTVSHGPSSDGSPISDVDFGCAPCDSWSFVSGDDGNDGVLSFGETWVFEAEVGTGAGTADPLVVAADVSGTDNNDDDLGDAVDHVIDLIDPGTIAGSVFEDLNGNGIRDSGEPAISGVKVRLTGGAVSTSAVTPADGSYHFNGLLPGDYDVKVAKSTLPDGVMATGAGSRAVDLPEGGSVADLEFGFAYPATISGTVFHDANFSGTRDGTETGERRIEVFLSDDEGNIIDSGRTNKNGRYRFTVEPGAYLVTLGTNLPRGWAATTGSDREVGTVGSGEGRSGYDFGIGNHPPRLLGSTQTISVGSAPAPLDAVDPEGSIPTVSLVGGELPSGITLRFDGVFGGTALSAGEFSLEIEVCDQAEPAACATFDYLLVVDAPVISQLDVLPFTGVDADVSLALAMALIAGGVALVLAFGTRGTLAGESSVDSQ